MFPTKIGESILKPMTVICNVEMPSKRGRGVFDDPFFNSMFRETQRQFLQSEAIPQAREYSFSGNTFTITPIQQDTTNREE